ncbi:MAG: 50S ribosomal protein L2 [Patescibacteria group bacterium]|nr:50S ribosomal protein L2 [Patescibacteria group bacterium]
MIKTYRPTSEGLRGRKTLVKEVSKERPLKRLTRGIAGPAGRGKGTVSVRHKQRGAKKLYRTIDFKRDKRDIPGKVAGIYDDPNRGCNIALINYSDGEKRYILAPETLKKGSQVLSSEKASFDVGNALPLSKIPLSMPIHNIETNPGAGGVLVRGAGNTALIVAKEGKYVNVRLPSGEVKKFFEDCYATIGSLSNPDRRNVRLGKAGRKRHLGSRPSVRGVAMNDPKKDHPHAGKYKTSGIGMSSPKTPWGKKARGVRTRKRKRTNRTIVKSRRK